VENGVARASHLRQGLRADLKVSIQVQAATHIISHAYTHFKVTAHIFDCVWKSGQPKSDKQVKWATLSSLANYPMGKVDRRIAQTLWP